MRGKIDMRSEILKSLIPQITDAINTDLMTEGELHAKLQKGYDDIEAGRVQNAEKVFTEFRKKH